MGWFTPWCGRVVLKYRTCSESCARAKATALARPRPRHRWRPAASGARLASWRCSGYAHWPWGSSSDAHSRSGPPSGGARFRALSRWCASVLYAILLLGALLACKVSNDLKGIVEVQQEIQAEFGVEAGVNSETANGVTTVTISLAKPPSVEPDEVKRRVTAIVRKHLPDTDNVVVNMNL